MQISGTNIPESVIGSISSSNSIELFTGSNCSYNFYYFNIFILLRVFYKQCLKYLYDILFNKIYKNLNYTNKNNIFK